MSRDRDTSLPFFYLRELAEGIEEQLGDLRRLALLLWQQRSPEGDDVASAYLGKISEIINDAELAANDIRMGAWGHEKQQAGEHTLHVVRGGRDDDHVTQ